MNYPDMIEGLETAWVRPDDGTDRNHRRMVDAVDAALAFLRDYEEEARDFLAEADPLLTAAGCAPIPAEFGLPTLAQVKDDCPHGTGWRLDMSGDQGPNAADVDRYFARFVSAEGWRADYFHFSGRWSIGAS